MSKYSPAKVFILLVFSCENFFVNMVMQLMLMNVEISLIYAKYHFFKNKKKHILSMPIINL